MKEREKKIQFIVTLYYEDDVPFSDQVGQFGTIDEAIEYANEKKKENRCATYYTIDKITTNLVTMRYDEL